jgi:hypothetical protein
MSLELLPLTPSLPSPSLPAAADVSWHYVAVDQPIGARGGGQMGCVGFLVKPSPLWALTMAGRTHSLIVNKH